MFVVEAPKGVEDVWPNKEVPPAGFPNRDMMVVYFLPKARLRGQATVWKTIRGIGRGLVNAAGEVLKKTKGIKVRSCAKLQCQMK